MAPVSTPAIVLHAFRYGETSKIVRLATRDLGVISVVARGALRGKSKFGARLELLSGGMAQIYVKPSRELQTLGEFDVMRQRHEIAGDMVRYQTASVMCELMIRVAPAEPHLELYEHLERYLDELVSCKPEALPAVALAGVWQLVCLLGFEPVLTACANDGAALPEQDIAFAVEIGGVMCDRCAAGRNVSRLRLEDRDTLLRLCDPDGDLTAVVIDPPTFAAHRRLLARFLKTHVAEGGTLRAVEQWERR